MAYRRGLLRMKHDSPGCATTDCCGGECWTCDDPVAIVLAGSDCCTDLDGTYAFGNYGAPTGNAACGAQYTPSSAVVMFIDTATTVTGGGSDRSCCIQTSTSNTFQCITLCETQSFADTTTSPGTTLRGCHVLVLYTATISAYVMNVAGSPTVFVVLSRTYRWYGIKASLFGVPCTSGLPSTYQYLQWVYEDTWEMIIDCDDPEADITHTGRSLVSATYSDGSDATGYTSADDDGFWWGFGSWSPPGGPEFRHDVCEMTANLTV